MVPWWKKRKEKRRKKGERGVVGEKERERMRGPNLVEEDCFHSVLKLKRSEDRRPRFESRLSAGDNQTEGDLFSPSPPLHLPPSFRAETEETEEETKWKRRRKKRRKRRKR